MKKTILSVSIGLLLLSGCSTENVDTQVEQQTEELVYVFNTNAVDATWEINNLDDFNNTKSKSSAAVSKGNSAHTHGSINRESITYNWSGTENNGGSHGSAVIVQNFGPIVVTITMETNCVSVLDNEAVYGGTITEVLNDPFNGFGPYALGNTLMFKVIDNGQGNNASADQYVQSLVSSSVSDCSNFPPDAFFWNSPFVTVADVEIGRVKVNN